MPTSETPDRTGAPASLAEDNPASSPHPADTATSAFGERHAENRDVHVLTSQPGASGCRTADAASTGFRRARIAAVSGGPRSRSHTSRVSVRKHYKRRETVTASRSRPRRRGGLRVAVAALAAVVAAGLGGAPVAAADGGIHGGAMAAPASTSSPVATDSGGDDVWPMIVGLLAAPDTSASHSQHHDDSDHPHRSG